MTQTLNAGGLPFRVCVYFAAAPESELTTNDVKSKFNPSLKRGLRWQLRHIEELGYIEVVGGQSGGSREQSIYRAGPTLLRMLGSKQ
jgi:hypothetical protein